MALVAATFLKRCHKPAFLNRAPPNNAEFKIKVDEGNKKVPTP